ncbi:MAG: hypothetical protein R3C68_14170 [Myxococcota bacterium]
MAPQTTVVISSHNLAELQEICTHGAILDHGKVVAQGELDTLTQRGAKITVEVAPHDDMPLATLALAFGEKMVKYEAPCLHIHFNNQHDVSDVIAKTLRLLLDHNVPILGVQRGASLEQAFLDVIERADPPRAGPV